ncbi:hypothetical protein V9T40_013338 [Parthenolecanium corni]|uniref:Ran-specific GTPase-activating protein n=1 Tax=Parthenolecanium corni TaxID=536013 RepID=A0AAN9Y521_9HEMI
MSDSTDKNQLDASENDNYEPDVHFEPVITLPLVDRVTLEEDEDILLKLRAKLYRFDSTETPPIWKERGTGEVKLLHHSTNHTVRVVMRRDKTLKICANHFVTPSMKLQRPTHNRKKWWIWTASTDFADEVAKSEIFAIKFATEENADLWRTKFAEAQTLISDMEASSEFKTDEKENKSDLLSESEAENFEDALDKSICAKGTDGLSESLLTLDISK